MRKLAAFLLLAGALQGAAAEKPLLFIDPGHGGAEAGVRSGGIEESALCLEMAKALQKQLKDLGVPSQLSREDNAKALAPSERARRANASGAKAFLALHINHAPSPFTRGARLFVPKPSQASKEGPLAWGASAGAWAEESKRLAEGLAPAFAPKAVVQSLQLAAFKGLALPAVFAEICYASHAESLERLKDASWRAELVGKMAQSLAKALKPGEAAP